MDNVFLTLVFLLVAVVQVNSSFYNAITAYIHRREAVFQAICGSSRVHKVVWTEIISDMKLKCLTGLSRFHFTTQYKNENVLVWTQVKTLC